MENVTLTLSKEDAELFVKFRQFQNIFERMAYHDAVDVKNGSVTLNFDPLGRITDITVIKRYSQR